MLLTILGTYALLINAPIAAGCGAAAGGAAAGAGAASVVGGGAGAAGVAGNVMGKSASQVISHSITHVHVVGGKCLYADADVRLADGTMRKVKNLAIGDRVLAYSPEKGVHASAIFGELHNDNETSVKLVEIETSSGRKIPVTPAHSLFVRPCLTDGRQWKTKSAYEVRPGECVPRYYPTEEDVVEEAVVGIRVFEARGIRQPITETGTIIVDDVVVSCYDRVVNQDAAHFALFPYRWLAHFTQAYVQHAKSAISSAVLTWIGFDMSLI